MNKLLLLLLLLGTPTNKLNGLKLTYKSDTEGGEETDVTLSPSPSHSRKQSIDWLKGLKKVQDLPNIAILLINFINCRGS